MIRKVLLVDDEADIRLIAEVALSRIAKWQVVHAASGAEALTLAVREMPDVILLDVMMPGMDGPTTLAELRANRATAGIPVIIVTAKVQPHERQRILELGVAGVVSKPFDALRLASEVTRLVEAWQP